MNEQIQQLHNKFTLELKEYLDKNSIYSPLTIKTEVESKEFPKVVVKELPRNSSYTTLKYTDERYFYGLEINVYAIQKNNVSKTAIAEEITNLIETFFRDVYRMNVKVSKDVPNTDTSVFRSIVQVTCVIDTKYKDKLIICLK